MKRNLLFFVAGGLCSIFFAYIFLVIAPGKTPAAAQDRAYWVELATRIARPVLSALSEGKLHEQIPKRDWESTTEDRTGTSPEEAFARTLAGIAPWLELGGDDSAEGKLRVNFIDMAHRALVNATDPQSPDFMDLGRPEQSLVEAGYLSEALLRAPTQIWGRLDSAERARLIADLKASRVIKPHDNNWLLFSAMVETALWKYTGECHKDRITNAINQFEQWYIGDGTYSDGPLFRWNYYNSYVIHPFLIDILHVAREKADPLGELLSKETSREGRYAVTLERLISPEGTFPVLGRSSAYRIAVFQPLAQAALNHTLFPENPPGVVRSAMTTVMHRMMDASGTFDQQGWLQIGAVGYQPDMHEHYNSTGALYLCMTAFLPLGLPATDAFWRQDGGDWTEKRLWAGKNEKADHAARLE